MYPIYTAFKEDVFSQVKKKIASLFTNNLPNEWGGYLILDGTVDEYNSCGRLTFVLNHFGPNATTSYEYLRELIDFLPEKRYFSYNEYDTFFAYEETITEQEPYYHPFF